MKIIAFYLPQFHQIPENDLWWGEGFTEWVNVKNAEPLFEGHNQPRVPLHDNYYNLLDSTVMKWQADLANQYGIYGFCMYHYWFGGHKLLEKPMENLRNDPSIPLRYCVCWANENWTNAWVSGERKILIKQEYGDKSEWKEHFLYLLSFFQDKRYIKEGNKPLVVIYRPDIISCRKEMFLYWNELAREYGFDGLCYASQFSDINSYGKEDSFIRYAIEYQPNFAARWLKSSNYLFLKKIKEKVMIQMDKLFRTSFFSTLYFEKGMEYRNYDTYWKAILKHKPVHDKCIAGAFVDWDCTPRKGKKGSVCTGVTVEKFKNYFVQLLHKVKKEYATEYIFVFAWNEWAEGGYLEPDTKNKFGYLEAIRDSLVDAEEWPD